MTERRTDLAVPGRVREITSFSNPAIKDIRALALKKHRDRQNAFIAEGLKLVVDALERRWKIGKLVLARSAWGQKAAENAAARAVAAGAEVYIVPEKLLGAITRRDNPQGVIGVFERRLARLPRVDADGEEVWVALDRVRDPGNLGTVIRTADAVGAKGVILVGDCTDPFGIEAVRATMGSIFAVPVCHCSEDEFLDWRRGFPGIVAGTHLAGSVDYRKPAYAGKPALLLMGNEQHGLSQRLAECCDVLVRIPQAGQADSLNLAVSTGIMLYEIRRASLKLESGTSR